MAPDNKVTNINIGQTGVSQTPSENMITCSKYSIPFRILKPKESIMYPRH